MPITRDKWGRFTRTPHKPPAMSSPQKLEEKFQEVWVDLEDKTNLKDYVLKYGMPKLLPTHLKSMFLNARWDGTGSNIYGYPIFVGDVPAVVLYPPRPLARNEYTVYTMQTSEGDYEYSRLVWNDGYENPQHFNAHESMFDVDSNYIPEHI